MAAFVSGHCHLRRFIDYEFLTSNGIGIGDIELIFILQLCTSIKFVATTVLIAAGLGILSLRSRYQALPLFPT